MSNIIPPLLSDTPPPPPDVDDHEEDEFGDFIGTNNVSFDCDDGFSLPGSPLQLPTEPFDFEKAPPEVIDINSNSKEIIEKQISGLNATKDFHDKRKHSGNEEMLEEAVSSNVLSVNKVECFLDPIELNITKETREIIETNCDKEETFSSQSEITKLSSEQFKELFSTVGESFPEDFRELASPVIVNEINLEASNSSRSSSDVEPLSHCEKRDDSCRAENLPNNGLKEQIQPAQMSGENSSSDKTIQPITDLKPSLNQPPSEVSTIGELANAAPAFNDADSDFGDFDDYKNGASEERKVENENLFSDFSSLSVKPAAVNDVDKEDDEFSDFVTPEVDQSAVEGIPEFANFASFPGPSQEVVDTEDDFGDFATTPIQSEPKIDKAHTNILLLDEKQAFEKATQILQEMFPPIEQSPPDFTFKGLEANDEIFNQIKNITDTHALSYHWTKSASQKILLQSLNIDSRNILFGPGWNPAMPRFASSLSVQPLEPVKSEILTPIPIKDASKPVSIKEPTKMEMGEAALVEPVGSLPVKEANNAPISSTISGLLELKESSKCESATLDHVKDAVEIPQTHLDPLPQVQLNDFDDFVSCLPPITQDTSHGHSVILRETHISNKESNKSEENDIVSWLEPTIVTPELSRKERQFVEGDEEYDDFQMVVPENQTSQLEENAKNLTVKPLASLQAHRIANNEQSKNVQPVMDPVAFVESTVEDDFGDFTFSVPNGPKTPRTETSSLALLEPLKPSVVKGQSVASISWPDPGVTDDEISRFEALGYARAQHVEPPKVAAKVTNPVQSKQNSLDDDEWSDFVSVQNSSPVHKLKMEKERSSTPDLPLSVLNLGTVHPTKQPIPVITPNGLMQTKLSSSTPLHLSNKAPQRNKVYPQAQVPVNHVYQPSIISNQFASQAYGGFSNYQPQPSNNAQQSSTEDDEWSDFVSHQPTVQVKSSWPHQSNQFSSWINSTPNIITNPAVNVSVQKHVKKVPASSCDGKNASMSNVSIPDLDFLAPRNRTTQRK